MPIYKSGSSISVKVITLGGVLVLFLVVVIVFVSHRNYMETIGIFLSSFILSVLYYFYSNSLKEVIVENETLILKKNIGKIEINFSEIESVRSMQNSAITMTTGSKGLFGFNGTTMDGSVSFVKNRSQMVKIITTSNKKYLISCDNSKELVSAIKIKSQS